MTKVIFRLLAASICLATTTAEAAPLITNGDFSNGLTGWTPYTTANGFSQSPIATSFDVNGDGQPETTSRLQVGTTVLLTPGGGGLSQLFNLANAGSVTFAADVAALGGSTYYNADGGTLSALIDGVSYSSFAVGGIGANQTVRSTLGFTTVLASGSHTLSLQSTRTYFTGTGVDSTPVNYFTNVSLASVTGAVPEPASWAMMMLGVGAVGFAMRRRQRVSARVAFG